MTQAHEQDQVHGGGEPRHVVPRSATRPVTTRTSAAFGAVDVGPPVSRLAAPAPVVSEPVPTPDPEPAALLPERCPHCNARVRGQQWCTLCHADLRPAPRSAAARHASDLDTAALDTAPLDTERPAPDVEQLELDFGVPAAPAAPVPSPPTGPALDEEEVERMLRRLATADVARVPALASKQAKVAVAVGGSLGLTALLLGGMALLGSITG